MDTPPGDERIVFSGVATMVDAAAVDPVTWGAELTMFGATGTILMQRDVPGGAYDKAQRSGWRANRAHTTFTYVAGSAGTVRLAFKRGRDPRTWTVRATIAGQAVAVTPADLPVTASVRLAPSSGVCVAVQFPGRKRGGCRLTDRALACR